MSDQILFVATMPSSRLADYYLGYIDGCVFLDFNNDEFGRIYLIRISFDGYGCCELGSQSIPLNDEDSNAFKAIIEEQVLAQEPLLKIVKEAIKLNKQLIWADALEEYHLS